MIESNSGYNKGILWRLTPVIIVIVLLTISTSAVSRYEYIRIKIDSNDGRESDATPWEDDFEDLWEFFPTDNGMIDPFLVDEEYTGYDCGLLLTEETNNARDIYKVGWAKKGVILGRGSNLDSDLGDDYKICCGAVTCIGRCDISKCDDKGVSRACCVEQGTDATCHSEQDDINNLLNKNYGQLEKNKCGDCSLSTNPSKAEYIFKYQALCDNSGKWALCDDDDACDSAPSLDSGEVHDFACQYDGSRGIWEDCTAQGKECANGVCVLMPKTCKELCGYMGYTEWSCGSTTECDSYPKCNGDVCYYDCYDGFNTDEDSDCLDPDEQQCYCYKTESCPGCDSTCTDSGCVTDLRCGTGEGQLCGGYDHAACTSNSNYCDTFPQCSDSKCKYNCKIYDEDIENDGCDTDKYPYCFCYREVDCPDCGNTNLCTDSGCVASSDGDDDTSSCDCSSWTDRGCGGDCDPDEMYQIRMCVPDGCAYEEHCIKLPDCACDDSDGGIDYKEFGTCTYLDTGYDDSCSDDTLTEYYCDGGCTSETKDCNSFDRTGCEIDEASLKEVYYDYFCSGGRCDYTGIVLKSITCDWNISCQWENCAGTFYRCYRTNSGKWAWGLSAESTETACDDGYNNDCDPGNYVDMEDPDCSGPVVTTTTSTVSTVPIDIGISMRTGDAIKAFYCFFLSISGAVTTFLIVLGAITWISSIGEPEKIAQAKMRIIWSLIALILVMLACPIINVLIQAAGISPVDCSCF